ncbi:MAG: hypothetical protein ACRD03_11225 [Acidimicrobiales bacterium]
MPPLRQRLALMLVTALATTALSAAATAGGADPSGPMMRTDAAFAVDGPVDALAARVTGGDRREAPPRSSTQRLVLLAIATALLAFSAFGRPRALRFDQPGPSRVSWWSPSVGRAPPFLQLAIV